MCFGPDGRFSRIAAAMGNRPPSGESGGTAPAPVVGPQTSTAGATPQFGLWRQAGYRAVAGTEDEPETEKRKPKTQRSQSLRIGPDPRVYSGVETPTGGINSPQ